MLWLLLCIYNKIKKKGKKLRLKGGAGVGQLLNSTNIFQTNNKIKSEISNQMKDISPHTLLFSIQEFNYSFSLKLKVVPALFTMLATQKNKSFFLSSLT